MKKVILFVLALVMILSVCGCSVKDTESKKDTSSISSDTSSKEEGSKTIPTVIAKELFDRNLKCTLEIFDLSTLDYEEQPVKDSLCPVKDERFKTFADLEEYVKATYVPKTADRLLYEPRFENHKLYQDVDGVFCIDTVVLGGKGYYVDWKDYDLKIESGDETHCVLKATATIEEPSDNPQKQPYEKTVSATKVDGNWLLDEVVY